MNGMFNLGIMPMQMNGMGQGIGGYQMPQIQAPQQNLSAYYNKPMISQQQYGDWLRNERPMRFITDFAIPAMIGNQRKRQYFENSANTTD